MLSCFRFSFVQLFIHLSNYSLNNTSLRILFAILTKFEILPLPLPLPLTLLNASFFIFCFVSHAKHSNKKELFFSDYCVILICCVIYTIHIVLNLPCATYRNTFEMLPHI